MLYEVITGLPSQIGSGAAHIGMQDHHRQLLVEQYQIEFGIVRYFLGAQAQCHTQAIEFVPVVAVVFEGHYQGFATPPE